MADTNRRTEVRIDDGVAWIRMDDHKVNALSTAMIHEVDAALDQAEAAGAVTVLTGREGIFSAGFDLGTFQQGLEASVEMIVAGARLIQRLLAFPLPVVTVCTGHAYPAGAFLMLSADVRFGTAGPWRIGLNEVAIGMTIPRFAVELARHRLSPPGFARITTGTMFDPDEACRLGYLDYVLPADQLDTAVEEEVARLRQLDMAAHAETKMRANQPALDAIGAALDEERRQVTGQSTDVTSAG